MGRPFPEGGTGSRRPHRARRQEGQFLDDGRDGPLRALLGGEREPAARRRRGPGAQARERRIPALHRDLEPRLHPVQCERRRHLLAPRREACRHRDGLRARRGDLRHDEGLHRFLQGAVQLRRRHLHTHLRADIGIVRPGLCRHGAGPAERPLGPGAHRRRVPGACGPRALRLVRDLRRDPSRKRGAQLCHPADPPPRRPLRPRPGAVDRLLREAGGARRGDPRGRLPGAQAPGGDDPPRRQVGGGELRKDARAGAQALRRGRLLRDRLERGRLRALRHLRLPARPDPGDRRRARRGRRRGRVRGADGGAARARALRPEARGDRRGDRERGRPLGARADRLHRLFARSPQGHPRDAPGRRQDRPGDLPRLRPEPLLRRDGRPGRRHRPRPRRGQAASDWGHGEGQVRTPPPPPRGRCVGPRDWSAGRAPGRPGPQARGPAQPHGHPPAPLGPAQGARDPRAPGGLPECGRPPSLRLLALRGRHPRPDPRDRGARERAGPRKRAGRGL